MAKLLMFMTDGFEETEAIAPADLLRRAGVEVAMASISDAKTVTGSHGITICADIALSDADLSSFDGCILPGGPGHKSLKENDEVKKIVQSMAMEGKLVSAICASPTVLAAFGVLKNKNACCFPGMEDELKIAGAVVKTEPVVSDGNIITSRGMGTACDFGFAIVEYLYDKNTAMDLAKSVVYRRA